MLWKVWACVYVYKIVYLLVCAKVLKAYLFPSLWSRIPTYIDMCVCVSSLVGSQQKHVVRAHSKKPTVRNRLSFKHFEIQLRD